MNSSFGPCRSNLAEMAATLVPDGGRDDKPGLLASRFTVCALRRGEESQLVGACSPGGSFALRIQCYHTRLSWQRIQHAHAFASHAKKTLDVRTTDITLVPHT